MVPKVDSMVGHQIGPKQNSSWQKLLPELVCKWLKELTDQIFSEQMLKSVYSTFHGLWLVPSSFRAPGPAKLGLVGTDSHHFHRHKTASGTARSNTEDRLHSSSTPPFIMARDCLWNTEEHLVGYLSPPFQGNHKRDKLNKGWVWLGT